jgi:hypothetical protein
VHKADEAGVLMDGDYVTTRYGQTMHSVLGMLRGLVLLLALPFSCYAAEMDACDPTENQVACLVKNTELHLNLCTLLVKLEGDTGRCIADALRHIDATYDRAIKSTKQAAVRDRIKDYTALARASVKGVTPARDERKISYETRQAATLDRLRAAGERLLLDVR